MDQKVTLAKRAAEIAMDAMKRGTFGVGGLIIENKSLRVLHTQENRVIADGHVHDPTGHVERQTVDWYYRRKAENSALPEPKDCTIVSSLDPCMMCGGSILAGGFNVVSLGLDPAVSVNHDGKYTFDALPPELAVQAAKSFSYVGVQGERAYQGFEGDVFHGVDLTKDITDMAATAFAESFGNVRGIVAAGDRSTIDCDVAELKANRSEVYGLVSAHDMHMPDRDLLMLHADRAVKTGSDYDSAMLKLPNGEPLMVRGSMSGISPIKTPVIRLIQHYADLQHQVRVHGLGELPHIKYCQIKMLNGPGQTGADIATLGAYGSAMEGPIPSDNPNSLVFLNPRQPQDKLDAMVAKFPPLYSEVIGVKPKRFVAG